MEVRKPPNLSPTCGVSLVEVVYLDAYGKALHQDIQWHAGAWVFVGDAQDGRPADKDTRLEPYVKMLRMDR